MVLFHSSEITVGEKPSFSEGLLTMVEVDGSGYRVLDEHNLVGGVAGLPAPSPDGERVAYGSGASSRLYLWDVGSQAFEPGDYGLAETGGELRLANPSWAPDGKHLAWVAHRDQQFGIAVFDLETRSAWLSHFYKPAGMDGFPPQPAWSPDGRWLAFVATAEKPDEAGLWVVEAAGNHLERRIALGSNPVWSPHGQWLAFVGAPDGRQWGHWIVDTLAWSMQPLGLASDVQLVVWLSP